MITLRNQSSGEKQELRVSNLFVMIGADPNTSWLRGHLELDHNGFIKIGGAPWEPISRLATSRSGVFAVGDVRAGSMKRVASSRRRRGVRRNFGYPLLSGEFGTGRLIGSLE